MSRTQTRQKRRLAEAADWFVRLGRTSISVEALHAFRRWRKRRENAEAYAVIERTWRAAGELGGDADLLAVAATALRDAETAPQT